ncbi:hypothetical protein RFI_27011 [Reticulomyxa filosa]|uniref:Chromate transporter n=1 Tax=Reticulomyxa filosa TaxID=46433 RepID=X6MBH9_RETFI|nr:hypothetical protein RFI_27011 [Reticulomyxa filosa]|eukprot:ETO10365.1 hypothetical protein RFI_27011 [Reticulomyxa filosa]
MSKTQGFMYFMMWLVLIIVMPVLRADDPSLPEIWKFFESCFRIGSFIYGGGQVVLPLLFEEVIHPGWLTEQEFWAGFALAQALPGAVSFGIGGALLGWIGLFGPGTLLIFAFLPLWQYVHKWQWFRIALQGINASAIGLIFAGCVLLWNSAVQTHADACVAVLTGALVGIFDVQAPIAIFVGAILGLLLSNTHIVFFAFVVETKTKHLQAILSLYPHFCDNKQPKICLLQLFILSKKPYHDQNFLFSYHYVLVVWQNKLKSLLKLFGT